VNDIEAAIGRVALFEKLSPRDRKGLAQSMHERTFKAGSRITHIGQEGVAFFIIDTGTAKVTSGAGKVAALGPGDHFGEIALIDEGPRTAEITAETDVKCYGLAAWEFRPFVQSHPDVAWALMQSLVRRWREQ
jgi:CRP-like cAMP-binding protein